MKRVLTIQDISCVGQCSLTVALPIISAFGIETAVIPTAVLSNHTAFSSFSFCDLTEELPKIEEVWKNQKIKFDGFYTGYIGSIKQIEYIKSIFQSSAKENAIKVVDPCMADHGKLYSGFSQDFPKEMLKLCMEADIVLPNLTELCFLLGVEYKEYSKDELESLVLQLSSITQSSVILTGVSLENGKLGSMTYNKQTKQYSYYFTDWIPAMFHGTGDCFASSFFGAIMKGYSLEKSSEIACEFTYRAVKNTYNDRDTHWYGVHFEDELKFLTQF